MPPSRRPARQPPADIEGNPPRQKRSKKQLREDIRALQQQALHAKEERQRTQRENKALRAQVAGCAGSAEVANFEGGAQNSRNLSKSEIKAWKKRAKNAGGRAVALYDPFIDIEPLAGHRVQTHFEEILDEVKRAQDLDEELEDDYNPAVYWNTPHFTVPNTLDLVCEMIYHLPKSPGNTWFEEWFQEKLQEGARKQRSALVHNIQTLHEKIFNITNKSFDDRLARPDLPEVQALQNFLHINEKDDAGNPNLDLFFKDAFLVRIHFVLSGDSVFEAGAGTVNYAAWFHGRLHLLERVYERHPDVYHNLIRYYNKEVLGIDSQGPNDDDGDALGALDSGTGLDAEDLEFLDQI